MANIKISELNELETKHRNDLLPIVNSSNNETEKIKVENLINENVELIAVSPTAPSECSLGDKYFNTTSNKLYTAIATNTWSSTGENAVEGILYIVFNEQSTYAYNGTTLVSVGGGSGSSDIVIIGDESETTEDTKLLVDTSGTTDTLKYKDNNTFTELQIKALDSMPVGTIVEFNGQASDIPSGWEEVDNVLWTNPNPTSTFAEQTINLEMSDYNYIEIYYRFYTGATGEQIATKIPVGSSAKFINEVWLEGIGETIAMRTVHTSSNNIVFTNTSVVALSDGTLRTTNLANGTMIPTKVIGYK